MRKLVSILFTLAVAVCGIAAQDFVLDGDGNSAKLYGKTDGITGIDYLAVFNGIRAGSTIQYVGAGSSYEWYRFSSPSSSISNQNYISPEKNTGYILNIDGGTRILYLWVIDYTDYETKISEIGFETDTKSACNSIGLAIKGDIKPVEYRTPGGVVQYIANEASVSYQTQSWGTNSWQTTDTTFTTILADNRIDVPAPLADTYFTVNIYSKISEDLDIQPASATSTQYGTLAVKNHILTTTQTREAENEDQRPTSADFREGSAPLEISFTANPTQSATFNQWTIYKENQFFFQRTDANFSYTFTDFGRYKAVLASSNRACTYTDSVIITVNESALEVPNVFTPNGDGINDEFRVAYRSLKSFEIAVFNRWGNKVYESNNPQQGWNGKIGNKDAVSAAYFYVIKAEGIDGKKYLKKGDINLIR